MPPVQDQPWEVYPSGDPASSRVYVPAFTLWAVTAAEPDGPEIGVGPLALRVHWARQRRTTVHRDLTSVRVAFGV